MWYMRRVSEARARWFGAGLVVLALGVLALAGGAAIGQAASQPADRCVRDQGAE